MMKANGDECLQNYKWEGGVAAKNEVFNMKFKNLFERKNNVLLKKTSGHKLKNSNITHPCLFFGG